MRCDELAPVHILKANLPFPRTRKSRNCRRANPIPIGHARILTKELNCELARVSVAPDPRNREANAPLPVLLNARRNVEVRLPAVEPIPEKLLAGRVKLIAVVDVIASKRQAIVQQRAVALSGDGLKVSSNAERLQHSPTLP